VPGSGESSCSSRSSTRARWERGPFSDPFVVGGVVTLRYRPARLLLVATLAVFPEILPLVLLAPAAPVWAIAAAAFAAGMAIELFGVFWDTALQQQIPHEQLSRVSSYDALGSIVFIPLGAAIAGPAADRFGVTETLLGAAVVIAVATALVLLVDDVRNLRRRPGQPDEAAAEARSSAVS
jgi:predicted MFS family arabinose efflux permease